jgi:pSer/pThr/pTyr-binding forkhead associated (FHA) protein
MPKFLLQFEGAVIKEIPAKDEFTVGREADNDVVIDNPAVSPHHCKIMRVGETYFVEDLNSTNGVFINARKVAKFRLQNNDLIGIAKHGLKFIDDRPQTNGSAQTDPGAPSIDATAAASQPEPAAAATGSPLRKPAIIRIVKGGVGPLEYELKNRSTYIGKADHVQIRIKGTGLFGSAPESAAMIANHPNGYYLIPVEEGYVKLNGRAVHQKELLKDGDVIQAGGTTLKFEDQTGKTLDIKSTSP